MQGNNEVLREQAFERALPNNVEAEAAILGAILLDNTVVDSVKSAVSIEDLYSQSHRKIYSAMLLLSDEDQPIDPLSIARILKNEKALESVGGISFITNLTYGLPFSSNVSHYVKYVRECARRRWLIKLSANLTERAIDGEETDQEIIAYAISQLDKAKSSSVDHRQPATLEQLADDQLLRYRHFFQGVSNALPTGFPEIDNNLMGGGLVPSGFYVLAAETSMGKTTLALDFGAKNAVRGKCVYVVSREMSREQLFDRLTAVEADVDRWKLRPGIWESDYRSVRDAVCRLAAHPIVLDDGSLTVTDIRGYLRERERRGQRVDLVVIDYLQLLQAEGKRKESRNQEVGSISRSLKGLAMEFQVPVVALSQLTRNPLKESREPELRDLRDSGEIEQDADAVFFLFGERPLEGARIYSRKFKCAKQREGPLFRIEEMPFDARLITYRRAEHFPNSVRTVTGGL